MRLWFLPILVMMTTPTFAQHAILYRDWKNCVSIMVDEQIHRGSMVPMVMLLNDAMLTCQPEGDLFAEDLQARNRGMSVRDRIDYINETRQKIRAEVTAEFDARDNGK